MNEINVLFSKIGLKIPNILLPEKSYDYSKWAVVACDQFTSQPEYWDEVKDIVGDNPSTLKITLPEIYLDENDVDKRIEKINSTMSDYFKNGILQDIGPCLILTERIFETGIKRKGLISAIDLEQYEYTEGAKALIRPTEGTVEDRLPPRLKIRKDAPLETPHILVLIDNPEKTVIEQLYDDKDSFEKIYDIDLMESGGKLHGYKVTDKKVLKNTADSLNHLIKKDVQKEKYGIDGSSPLLYAMGDGNHSLATAKAHWENIKKDLSIEQINTHPARYALVEIVNLHDPGIVFEPIHRVLFNVDEEDFFKDTLQYIKTKYPKSEISSKKPENTENNHVIEVHTGKDIQYLNIKNPVFSIEYGTIQDYLDTYLKDNPNVKIDYIHGDNTLKSLVEQSNTIGFKMPPLSKLSLFKTVIEEGVLPRKSFSMGEANEKRYYVECRKII